ncbi:MAG: hypothetical protein A2066_19470 [Bacteroidetes bacterium GWB2_41_8]|nr:MAG: hypothetical protein A2066_19470 [Bacteroidetes bacterium GWB2_41_8]
MKIMKTKIRTFIAMSALGIIGITNISATADNKKVFNAGIVAETEEVLNIESWMTEGIYWTSETKVSTFEAEKALEVEAWMTDESFWTSETSVNTVEAEEALEVESWMTDESLWN